MRIGLMLAGIIVMSLSTGTTNAQNIQNIIGGMIGSAMQKNHHVERRSLSEEERQCLLRVTQGIPRIHQALERGTLSPFDPRVAEFRASCIKKTVTPEQVSAGNNPKFQILVLANLSATDVTRTLDGKINFSGKSSDGKSEISAGVERFNSSIAARSFDIQIMSQIPGTTVTGNRVNREYLLSVLERAFRKKHPEITAKISMTWSSGASLIFVPKYDFSGAQNFGNEIAQKKMAIIDVIELSEFREAYNENRRNIIANREHQEAANSSVINPDASNGNKFSAIRFGTSGHRVCTLKSDFMAEKLGVLLLPSFQTWLGKSGKPDIAFDDTYANLEAVYADLQKGNISCSVLVEQVSNLSKITTALSRDGQKFAAFGELHDADELRLAFARTKGFNNLDDFNFAVALNQPLRQIDIQSLRSKGINNAGDFDQVARRMANAGYSNGRGFADIMSFLEDEAQAKREGTTAIALRDKRAAVAQELEQRGRDELAKEFPYQAFIVCGQPQIVVQGCFTHKGLNGDFELRNGDQYKLYKVYQLGEAGEMTRNGLKVLLREHFEIKLQNVHPVFALELTIISTKTGQRVFQKAASEFGVISVRN